MAFTTARREFCRTDWMAVIRRIESLEALSLLLNQSKLSRATPCCCQTQEVCFGPE